MILATFAARQAGSTVKEQTSALLEKQVSSGLGSATIQAAKIFSLKFQNLKGSAALLGEIIRDRIVGYPTDFEDDRYVPFVDIDTGRNGYPLRGNPLPRNHEIIPNLTPETLHEHVQERAEIFRPLMSLVSTATASFCFQGNCDPNETDPTKPTYSDNCTIVNNDPKFGGAIHRVPTLAGLAQKAYDLGIFLKPLFEADQSIMQIHVYFFNSAAGAVLSFPSIRVNSSMTYVSTGCEWMRQDNMITTRPFGGDEEIARCHPEGTEVPIRLYNPMEREFCRDQALHPGKIRIHGPYIDVGRGLWRLTIGQAVFDRKTGEFIACTAHDLDLALAQDLMRSISVNTRTKSALVRLDGTLVAGWGLEFATNNVTVNIVDTEFVDQKTYDALTVDRFWEDSIWDATTVMQKLSTNFVDRNDQVLAVVPIPLPPDNFDKDYEPDFLLFIQADVDDVNGLVDQINEATEDEVGDLIMSSVFIGLGGLTVFLFVVASVSHILTRPLTWMETTAWKIVNHADKRVSEDLVVPDALNEEDNPLVQCSPKTEIRELVTEFQAMIRGFSGTGASRVAPAKMDEVKNFVTWKDDFKQFYQLNQTMEDRIKEEMSQKAQSYGRRISMGKRSRNNSSYGQTASEIIANMSEVSQVSEEEGTFRSVDLRKEAGLQGQFGRTDSSTLFKRPLTRTNLGSNLHGSYRQRYNMEENIRISRSTLFRWVLCSIVLPLVLTNIVIAAIVANNLLESFPGSVKKADAFSFDLAADFLLNYGKSYALFGEQVLPGSIRDLHLLTRTAGWLLFDAVARSDIFSDVEIAMVEDCKEFGSDEVCPFDADPARSPCDCEWSDPWGEDCDKFSVRTRALQKMWYICQARDYDPETGDRLRSLSFPEFDFNPISTKWWTDANDLPGADKGSNASGYETTYDRLRVISALQTIAMPLYNYFTMTGYQGSRTSMSSYFAFEADGGYLGYSGCNYDPSRYAQFKSSEENGAYLISPELCPLDKYGYDPRCRPWYRETKQKSLYQGQFVHVMAPYRFAGADTVGTTACSGVVDPETGEYIGTSAIDLSPTDLFNKEQQVLLPQKPCHPNGMKKRQNRPNTSLKRPCKTPPKRPSMFPY